MEAPLSDRITRINNNLGALSVPSGKLPTQVVAQITPPIQSIARLMPPLSGDNYSPTGSYDPRAVLDNIVTSLRPTATAESAVLILKIIKYLRIIEKVLAAEGTTSQDSSRPDDLNTLATKLYSLAARSTDSKPVRISVDQGNGFIYSHHFKLSDDGRFFSFTVNGNSHQVDLAGEHWFKKLTPSSLKTKKDVLKKRLTDAGYIVDGWGRDSLFLTKDQSFAVALVHSNRDEREDPEWPCLVKIAGETKAIKQLFREIEISSTSVNVDQYTQLSDGSVVVPLNVKGRGQTLLNLTSE